MSHPFRLIYPATHSSAFAGRCAFTVMAKVPAPGRVKTRLSPPLSPEEAAGLNAVFLRDTVANLQSAAEECAADCVISYTPVGQEAGFSGILPEGTLLVPQRGDGFGERLLGTAADLLQAGFAAVCLIDSDSPTVPTGEFVRAARALLEGSSQAVLGASEDGGYYLLGLSAPHARLFGDITWSTASVAEETRERAAELGLSVLELARWYDVDDRESLARLHAEIAGAALVGYPAPHTRTFLVALETASLVGNKRL